LAKVFLEVNCVGYKVAKVDQLENAMGKSLRERESVSKKDKVIRRELTAVLTNGTLIDGGMLTSDMSTYCMCIKESSGGNYGISFVGIILLFKQLDTATSEFNLCLIKGDADHSILETLLLQIKPKEMVLEKGNVSKALLKLVKNSLDNCEVNLLAQDSEFWSVETADDELGSKKYLGEHDTWPEAVKEIRDTLALSALGGLVYYLRTVCIIL
jgi:DNA mismatch repair protein MSH6